jgi:cellulose synthase operon protein C
MASVASLAPFDHAIVYVPSLDLYLDGTAEHSGSEELPAMDVGALAVLVNQGDAKLVHLPGPDPKRNVRRRELTARLQRDGTAPLELSFENRGVGAPEWRRRYQAEATRRERVEQDIAKELPGFRLLPDAGHLVTSDLSNIEEPVRLSVRGTSRAFARREDERLSVAATPRIRLTPTYASRSERRLPVRVAPFSTIDDTVVLHLPSGMRVVSAPPDAKHDGPVGAYSVQVEQE